MVIAKVVSGKVCLQCSKRYIKKANQSRKQWERQKFCTIKCGTIFYHPVITTPERLKEQYKKWGDKKIINGYYRKLNLKWRLKVIDSLGGRCSRCGFNDVRALQIDHVNNDGNIERQSKLKSSIQRHKIVLNDTEDRFQLLCANCNWIKKAQYHQSKYGKIEL